MGNFCLAEELLVSQKGLRCMNLVSSEHISSRRGKLGVERGASSLHFHGWTEVTSLAEHQVSMCQGTSVPG